jgi:hypothetical protein
MAMTGVSWELEASMRFLVGNLLDSAGKLKELSNQDFV